LRRGIQKQKEAKMKKLILFLLCGPAMAQHQIVYHMIYSLDGAPYEGYFTWQPNTVTGMQGQPEPGPGIYSNVSVTDPYGTFIQAYDVFEGADYNINQHSLWFKDINGGLMNVNIPQVGMGGQSVPIIGYWIDTNPTATTCAGDCGTMTALPESVDGATIPMAAQIIDSELDVWTMINGQALKNGVATPSAAVVMLLYSKGHVYQENYHHNWWKWVKGKWVVDTSPHSSYSCPAP
jgi:hypothetical protein